MLAASQSGPPVLELGCGSGWILIPVAESGTRIVGIERSPEMLALLRPKVAAMSPGQRRFLCALRGDMRFFSLRDLFSLVIIPYRAFQHLLTDNEQIQCLKNIREHLLPGGAFVFNVFDPSGVLSEQTEPILDAQFELAQGGTTQVCYTRSIDRSEQLLRQELIFDERDGNDVLLSRKLTTLSLRYSSRAHIENALQESGFEIAAVYGGFHGEPVSDGGEQVWVAVNKV